MKTYKKYKDLFFLKLGRRFSKIYSPDCFGSIDEMPIFYWNKIHETGNLSYLIKSKTTHINKPFPSKMIEGALSMQWRKLLDEHIARFGFPETYLDIFRKQKEILRLKIERMTSEDVSLGVFIDIAERDLKELEVVSKSGGGTFHDLKAIVELEWGHLNPMVVTVGEFYSYVKILQSRKRKAKQADGK